MRRRRSIKRQRDGGQGRDMDRLKEIIEQIWFVLPFGIWASLGYMCLVLQTSWPGWKMWLSQCIIAFLSGATFGLLLADTGMSTFMLCGICSCVGISGGKIVEDLAKWARRRAEKIVTGDAQPAQPYGGGEDGEDRA